MLGGVAAFIVGTTAAACFTPPGADVMFACDPNAAQPVCPSGYFCAADGCCHRDGTDPEQQAGACGLSTLGEPATSTSGGAGTAIPPTTSGISSTSGATGTGGSDTSTGGSDTSTSAAAT